jgi:hypothetical protein
MNGKNFEKMCEPIVLYLLAKYDGFNRIENAHNVCLDPPPFPL